MTKSRATVDFVGLYSAILTDYQRYQPTDFMELERDNKRLSTQHAERGLPLFTVELPKLGKGFLASLELKRLCIAGLPHSAARSNTDRRPRLFWAIWSRIFSEDGILLEAADVVAIHFLRTLLDTGKKVKLLCADRLIAESVEEYVSSDSSLPTPSPFWEAEPGFLSSFHMRGSLTDYIACGRSGLAHRNLRSTYDDLEEYQRTADRLGAELGFIEPSALLPRHGPGAVSDLRQGQDKYLFPTWSERLESMFEFDSFGLMNPAVNLECSLPDDGAPNFVEGVSKLVAVPKTQTGPRLIASEPASNQWIQQAVAQELRRRVSASSLGRSIDFFDQKPSQDAAIKASLERTHATIDLKSASDRLSCYLVERMFRSNFQLLKLLQSCRTKYVRQDYAKRADNLIKLRKFASQGNALTFPVQSIVFTMLAVGVGKTLHPKASLKSLCSEVRVFGDDIIVPNLWAEKLIPLLEELDLRVNRTKTFLSGKFRESCGMDAYDGIDVTPAYVRSLYIEADARSVASWLAVQNNFHLRGFWVAADFLRRTTLSGIEFPVVSMHAGSAGYVSYCGSKVEAPKRFNQDLHRDEYLVNVFVAKTKSIKPSSHRGLTEFGFRVETRPLLRPWDPAKPVTLGIPEKASLIVKRRWVPSDVFA